MKKRDLWGGPYFKVGDHVMVDGCDEPPHHYLPYPAVVVEGPIKATWGGNTYSYFVEPGHFRHCSCPNDIRYPHRHHVAETILTPRNALEVLADIE